MKKNGKKRKFIIIESHRLDRFNCVFLKSYIPIYRYTYYLYSYILSIGINNNWKVTNYYAVS